MKNLLIALVVIVMTGCAVLQPEVDECQFYQTRIEQSYCYVSKEVEAAYSATAQSLTDKAITVEQAIKVRAQLHKADMALASVKVAMDMGDTAKANAGVVLVRNILLEVVDE